MINLNALILEKNWKKEERFKKPDSTVRLLVQQVGHIPCIGPNRAQSHFSYGPRINQDLFLSAKSWVSMVAYLDMSKCVSKQNKQTLNKIEHKICH